MEDSTYSAPRASAAGRSVPGEPDTRFRALVQSPLRAGLLRYLHARPEEVFGIDGLMHAFGRLRLDVTSTLLPS